MRKVFSKIHLWLSVPFGIIIAITCITGASLIFETEINELTMPNRYFVKEVTGQPLPLNELMRNVVRTLPDSVSITGVAISSDPQRTYQVNLSKPRRAALFINQYTGEIIDKNERIPFFTFMFRMHRWLLDSMKPDREIFWGKMIVGVSTIMFVFVLLSGLVIWVPRSLKGLKNRLCIATKKGQHRFWFDLHVAGGFYATLLLLVMALTGLTWSFPWYRSAFYTVFGVEVQQGAPHSNATQPKVKKEQITSQSTLAQNSDDSSENSQSLKPRGEGKRSAASQREAGGRADSNEKSKVVKHGGTFRHWQQIFNELSNNNPTFKQLVIADGSANVSFAEMGNQRASDKYVFSKDSGKITAIELYENQSKANKIRGWIYSVHVGNWGGVITKILYFVAALLGTILPLTGYYLWIRRLIKKNSRK